MITTARVDNSEIEDGLRTIKVEQFGAKTANESLPYGFDSSPIRDMVAIYAETSENGEPVIIGYINENQLAKEGETRLFSNGTEIWLRNDGKIELGGNKRNLVAYQDLNQSLQDFKTDIQAELVKIAAALGGAYTPGTLNINLSESKLNNLLTE